MHSSSKDIPIASSQRMNHHFADRFFQKIFENESALKDLLGYVGEPIETRGTINLTHSYPVLIGNRSNDLSFLWNGIFYYFFEHQSTENYNMPIRTLFYVSHALENYLEGKRIFGKPRLDLPEIKCYVLFTGITEAIPETLETIQKLSEAYLSRSLKRSETEPHFDLELCVHCFDLKITGEECIKFLEENQFPERFQTIESVVVQYALFVNVIKYRLKEENVEKNTLRAKQIIVETCQLFLERQYLVDYFKNSEVIDMAVEQLTYEEIIRFQEREEGREEGKKEGEKEKLKKQIRKKLEKGKSVETIAEELEEEDINTIWQIMIEMEEIQQTTK